MEKLKQKITPYIVKIRNGEINDEPNVVFFDAKNQLQYAGIGDSYGNSAWIHITCPDPNVTYTQMLYEIMEKSFLVRSLYITGSGSGRFPFQDKMIMQALKYERYNAKGIADAKSIVPILDPYQKISNAVYYNKELFEVNADTKITIPIMYAESSIIYYFYPKNNVDISRAIENNMDAALKNITDEFEKDDIIRTQKAITVQ